jgi:quercetin dioxygenase-like cupin family protein
VPEVLILDGAGGYTEPPAGAGSHWVEHLRVSDLSVGTYSLPKGGLDEQEPHTEDEVYVVTRGRARLLAGPQVAEIGPGSVIFVPAGEVHRFTDVTEDLSLLVFFGPAEYSRRIPPGPGPPHPDPGPAP